MHDVIHGESQRSSSGDGSSSGSGDDARRPTLPDGVRLLDPATLMLTRSPGGALRAVVDNRVGYRRVNVRRLLPLSRPDGYVALWAGDEEEIGILRDLGGLDPAARAEIEAELARRYFLPVIERIDRVRERFGVHEWQVRTSRGRTRFFVTGLHQNIKLTPPARVLVTDVRGNRYDIPDYRRLDRDSFRRIQRVL